METELIEKPETVGDVPEGMRAFDRAEALAGAELITRGRMAVESLNITDESDAYPLTAIVNKRPRAITNNGEWLGDGDRSDFDLFIVDKPTTSKSQQTMSVPDGLFPFDESAAFAGCLVKTRGGSTATSFEKIDASLAAGGWSFIASVDGFVRRYAQDGTIGHEIETELDLFMAYAPTVEVASEPKPKEAMDSIPEGCEPFNLKRALAGDAVITRQGDSVGQFHKFDVQEGPANILIENIAGVHSVIGVQSFTESGRFSEHEETCFDLFMKRKTKTFCIWVRDRKPVFGETSRMPHIIAIPLGESPKWQIDSGYSECPPDNPVHTREVFV